MPDDNTRFFFKDTLNTSINAFQEREYLIDGFLYKHSSLMIYAADGVGKSVVTLQACLEASSGSHVFGAFKSARPLRTLWIMAERHPMEMFERIKQMSSMIKINPAHFAITTELQGFNILNENFLKQALDIIKHRVALMGGVDIIVVDPIYALVAGGLAKDENDSAVTRFSTMLQNSFFCSTIFIHHSNRGVRDSDTGKRKGEDMYGGRFLSAHFTGVYHIQSCPGGVRFKRDKSSHSNLLESFNLSFDMDSYISTLRDDSMQKKDRLIIELRRLRDANKWATIEEISDAAQLSTPYSYKLISRELNQHLRKDPNSRGRKTLYLYTGA